MINVTNVYLISDQENSIEYSIFCPHFTFLCLHDFLTLTLFQCLRFLQPTVYIFIHSFDLTFIKYLDYTDIISMQTISNI